MGSISKLTRDVLDENPAMRELLLSGCGNISAIAKSIKPEIEKRSGSRVRLGAVSMSIRRHLESAPLPQRKPKFPKHIDITSRSNMYEIAFATSAKSRELALKIRRDLSIPKSDLLSIVEGSYEIVVFTNQKNRAELLRIIKGTKCTSERSELAYVTVNWPESTKDIPGIYYRVTGALAQSKVSIQSFHTIGAEMMVFVRNSDLPVAHKAISDLLNNSNWGQI